jgi:hypothetical protein
LLLSIVAKAMDETMIIDIAAETPKTLIWKLLLKNCQ